MRTHTHNLEGRSGGRRAFTLIELLVVILIIAILMALLLAGLRAVFRSAQGVADLQAARAMGTGIDQFEGDNGFIVPLVADGNPLMLDDPPPLPSLLDKAYQDGAIEPYDGGGFENLPLMQSTFGAEIASVAVYSDSRDIDFLRGGRLYDGDGPAGGNIAEEAVVFELSRSGVTSDRRYSKFALPIYLSGILDRSVDGVDGPGLTAPARDGTFAGVTGQGARTPRDAYMDSAQDFVEIVTGYSSNLEIQEHHGEGAGGLLTGRPFGTAYVDRYGNAFRYYRWEPGRNSRVLDDLGGTLGASTNAIDTNVPFVLSDMIAYAQQQGELSGLPAGITAREQVDATGGNTELRKARWAIVSAGPDGFFGTEPMSVLDRSGTAQTPDEIARVRARAQEDNVVMIEQ
ncbi:MAG: type II secretion system protein [Phycisphaerales bacterium]